MVNYENKYFFFIIFLKINLFDLVRIKKKFIKKKNYKKKNFESQFFAGITFNIFLKIGSIKIKFKF